LDQLAAVENALKIRCIVAPFSVYFLLLVLPACKKSQPATADSDDANWTTYGRTADEQRFSPLKQINDENAGQLGLVWSRELGSTRGLEATCFERRDLHHWRMEHGLRARCKNRRNPVDF
jgi:hypothetical protein